MARGLFTKKAISTLLKESQDKGQGLKRTLGALNLTTMGIGAIIGAGIFVLAGPAAAEFSGPAIVLSLIIVGILCSLVALCYAEFSALIPISGSAYSYAYATMGELVAWIIGWGLTLEYLISSCTVAVGWSGYFVSLMNDCGITIPQALSNAPFTYDPAFGWGPSGSLFNLPALVIVGLIGLMIAVGMKTAAKINDIMVVIKLSIIVLFIACGIAFINVENWKPFIPDNTGFFGQFGWSGILRGAGVVFFAFIGFDAVSTLAQEARNPQRDMPKGMLSSLWISVVAYVLVALVLTGIVSYTQLNVPDPIAVAINAMGPGFIWLRYVLKIAILAGLASVCLVMLMGQTRIFYTMANDGLLPPLFGKVSKKTGTPLFTTLVVILIGMLVAALFPVVILAQLVNMGTLFIFAIVCFGVLVLRYTQPLLHRPFKTPLLPWIPLAGTLACLVLMLALPGVTWVQFAAWTLFGCWVYFVYGQKHSRVRNGSKGK